MISRLKNELKKALIKINVVDTVAIGEDIYKVIDYTSPLPFIKDQRNLSFKNSDGVHSHSAIYLNPKYHIQPIFRIPQDIIGLWSKDNTVKNGLVLGCAGCSVPRFISLHYPESKTIGIELSADFIKIAKKHFLLKQIEKQFDLIQGDAIKYIKEHKFKEKQDVIYIDIFDKNKIIKDIFTEDFIKAVYDCTADNGLIIINIFGEDINETASFFNNLNLPYVDSFIVENNNAQFMVVTKNQNPEKAEGFKKSISNLKGITVH